MKSLYLFLACAFSICAFSQPAADMAGSPAIVESGPNHNIWETVLAIGSPDEPQRFETNRIVELGTCLNYLSNGKWIPASEDIEAFPGGAIAQHGQCKVIFDNNLATPGAIDLELSDGQRLRSHILGLAYLDPATRKHVLFAEVKDCQGEILPPNQVIYRDAFDGASASVRYTYTRAGFEQDILIEAPLPAPEDFGLSGSSTLQALTEFLDRPQPTAIERPARLASGDLATDTDLDFGPMQIVRGHAFFMPINDSLEPVPSTKQWEIMENRYFLVEQLPIPELKAHLDSLGKSQGASLQSKASRKLVASNQLRLPPPRARVASQKPMLLAQRPAPSPVITWDYVTLNTSYTNYVFAQDQTYYLSADVALFGTNSVFEPGSVLKLNTNVTLTVRTPVTWLGRDYRPVFITSRMDNTVGSQVAAGSPGSEYYAATALFFDAAAAGTNLVIQNAKIANARTAIAISGGSGHVLSHVQILTCAKGLALTNTDAAVRNALFDHVMTNFTGSSSTVRTEHLTSDTANTLFSGVTLTLTNSILAGVTNIGAYTAESCTTAASPAGLFASTAGAGSHYLIEGSTNRNSGSANINAALALALRRLTTYPPADYSSLVITSATTWVPLVQRDTDVADRGYHYASLDALCSNTTIRASLSLSNGVGIGIMGSPGLQVQAGGGVYSLGNPLALNAFASYQNVQEQLLSLGAATTFLQNTSYCRLDFRFSEFSIGQGLQGMLADLYRQNDRSLPERVWFRDCQARGCKLAVQDCYNVGPPYAATVGLTNNLFERCYLAFSHGIYGNFSYTNNITVNLYNNLCRKGTVAWSYYAGSLNPNWQIRDNLFDNPSLSLSYDYPPTQVQASNNGFTTGTSNPLGGSNNKTGFTADYQVGALGPYYYPTNGGNLSQLINAGSRYATNATLYHFTTTTDSVKEGGTVVDIGWHVAALDASGNPADFDGDGLIDIFEDLNGSGAVDSGETDWQSATDAGLKVLITRPAANTLIP